MTCIIHSAMPKALVPISASEDRQDALHPEVIDPRIADVEALARWMDYAFVLPGGFRYGLAGLIGLIPGIGDIFDALLSLYIVGRAVQLRVPRVTVARMVVNVGIEAATGAVPFAGALFDTVFKANRRNYRLLKDQLSAPRQGNSRDWWFLIITVVLLLASVAIPIFLLVKLAQHL